MTDSPSSLRGTSSSAARLNLERRIEELERLARRTAHARFKPWTDRDCRLTPGGSAFRRNKKAQAAWQRLLSEELAKRQGQIDSLKRKLQRMKDPVRQKGTGINAENLQEHLESAANAANKGQAQYFSPRPFAALCALALPSARVHLCDLNCGAGNLLFASAQKETRSLLGCDIDPCRAVKEEGDLLSITRITADVTKLYALLKEVAWQCDLFVLNPPWDLHQYRDRLAALGESELLTVQKAFAGRDPRLGKDTIDSTIATLLMALDLMAQRGEGFLIANQDTLDRLLFNPDGAHRTAAVHVWANIVIRGNPITGIEGHAWEDTGFRTGVVYFAKGHLEGRRFTRDVGSIAEFEAAVRELATHRARYRRGPEVLSSYQAREETQQLWMAVRDEWNVRSGKKGCDGWNIWLAPDGTIHTHLSFFESRSFKVDKREAERLFALNGERPMQLVMQAAQRAELVHAVKGGIWRVHPDLPKAVDEAIAAYHSVRAPLYKLSPIQSLGYLDEEDHIVCKKDLEILGGDLEGEFRAAVEKFLTEPTPQTWDAIAHRLVRGKKTLWQLVCQRDNTFPDRLQNRGEWPRIPDAESVRSLFNRKLVFRAGNTYRLRTQTVRVERRTTKPNLSAGFDEVLLNGQELAICITDEGEMERCFMDARHRAADVQVDGDVSIDFVLQDLAEHFQIPEVPDVAECDPAGFSQYLQRLGELEELINGVAV